MQFPHVVKSLLSSCITLFLMKSNLCLNTTYVQLGVQCLHDYAGFNTSVGLTADPIANFSGVIGNTVASLGTDVSIDTKTGNFLKYNAGLSFTSADLIASLAV